MMLGGFTGTMPLLFPEAIGGNARYKQELKQYGEAMDRIALGDAARGCFRPVQR